VQSSGEEDANTLQQFSVNKIVTHTTSFNPCEVEIRFDGPLAIFLIGAQVRYFQYQGENSFRGSKVTFLNLNPEEWNVDWTPATGGEIRFKVLEQNGNISNQIVKFDKPTTLKGPWDSVVAKPLTGSSVSLEGKSEQPSLIKLSNGCYL
jgi:hypothetical protein